MKRVLYSIIFSPPINWLLRNTIKFLAPTFPGIYRIPPSGVIKIEAGQQHLKLKTNPSSYLTQVVYWKGAGAFEYTSIFVALIRSVGCFYDVGSNIGYYALLAAKCNPGCRVTAFEPARDPFLFLEKNVELNRLQSHITCEAMALSDRDGMITFHEFRNPGSWIRKHNLSGAGSTIPTEHTVSYPVQATTLNIYSASHPEDIVDLIKLDTEGTEPDILREADRVLRTMAPIVICETLFNQNEGALESLLGGFGYAFYNHTEAGLQRVDTLRREGDNGVRNCFFVHPVRQRFIEPFVLQ